MSVKLDKDLKRVINLLSHIKYLHLALHSLFHLQELSDLLSCILQSMVKICDDGVEEMVKIGI